MPGEKTEKATPKRKKDERKKGNVFLSQDVVTVFTLLATFYVIKLIMPFSIESIIECIQHFFDLAGTTEKLTQAGVKNYFFDACILFVKSALIPLLTCCLVATLATLLQTKMLVSFKAAKFKAERISPIKGFKKMFSMRSLVELVKSILKIAILLYIVYSELKDELFVLPRMTDMTFETAMFKTGTIIIDVVIKSSVVFIFLGVGDFLYQRYEYEKNLRMSKQEIKDEYKQTEGDPQIKGHIKQLQQQKAQQRMMQAVPEADVVIKNPTHVAIAIKYDTEANRAPVVVAKGLDSLALRIIATAEENGVYITENIPLAHALYDTVELNSEIPEKYYKPIAEVLAYVYSLKKKGRE